LNELAEFLKNKFDSVNESIESLLALLEKNVNDLVKLFGGQQEQIHTMRMDIVDSKMMTVIEKQITDLATLVHAHLAKCSGFGFQRQSQAETVVTPEQIKCNTF
jgi:succinate dehydrogenase flavin-adding protein (antitoxin of CptAB toxin-antitoxin module)